MLYMESQNQETTHLEKNEKTGDSTIVVKDDNTKFIKTINYQNGETPEVSYSFDSSSEQKLFEKDLRVKAEELKLIQRKSMSFFSFYDKANSGLIKQLLDDLIEANDASCAFTH